MAQNSIKAKTVFQSTLPREERPKGCVHRVSCHSISIHAPTRGATQINSLINEVGKYFNPRSHERSDKYDCIEWMESHISIHAPTRGATIPLCGLSTHQYISIHAPTRGATMYSSSDGFTFCISIHAPTRGATSFRFHQSASHFYFNPRSHERSDRDSFNCTACRYLFQSTLPREERLIGLLNYNRLILFQSTLPREERLLHQECCLPDNRISIHAPTRGATK